MWGWKCIGGGRVFARRCNVKSVATLILINGEDDFLKERAAEDEAKMSLAESVLRFRFPEEAQEYLDEIDMGSLVDSPTAFVILNASDVPPLSSADSVTTIVVAASKKTLEAANAKRVLNFQKFRPRDEEAVIRWILKEGDGFNIDLKRVASALFVNHGNDLRKISSEIRKLALVVGPDRVVNPVDARPVMCSSADITPGYVIDAVSTGHAVQALAFCDRLQERNVETGWILAYMQRHVLQCLRLETMKAAGMPAERISEALGVSLWTYQNYLTPCVGLWAIPSLVQSMETLCDLEIAHKRGEEARWGLELEIIRLSEEAKQNVERRGSS